MISVTLPLLGLVALGAAQSSTVSLFLPFADPQSLVASIAGSDSTATTYVVQCANPITATASTAVSAAVSTSSSHSGACGFSSAFTVVEGPSTVHYKITDHTRVNKTLDCTLSGTTFAACKYGDSINTSGVLGFPHRPTDSNGMYKVMSPTITTNSAVTSGYLPVVITAGAANVKPASGISATATGGSSTVTGTATSKVSASKTSSAAALSQTSNAAVGGRPLVGAGILGAFGVAIARVLL